MIPRCINIEIEKGSQDSAGDLTVVAFTDDDSPSGNLKSGHESDVYQSRFLFSRTRGFTANDIRKSDQSLLWWKFENITEFWRANDEPTHRKYTEAPSKTWPLAKLLKWMGTD